MPHVAFVSFTGFRVREKELLARGMSLPSLRARGEAIGALPSLGLLTLAGQTNEPWSKSWHESDRSNDILHEVLSNSPDLVAVSALTASIDEAYAFSDRLREAGVQTVGGGLHVTACPDEASKRFDAIACGDGESVWKEILRDADHQSLRSRYRAHHPFDLRRAPIPDYSLLPAGPRPRFTLQTERGCPFACSFCAASRLLGPFREKPIAQIRQELDTIRALDPHPLIELADDNTFARNGSTEPLLRTLQDGKVRYFTETDWRIGERPELLPLLARSGCVQLLVGIESLVFRYPGMGEKAAPLSRILEAVSAIQAAGIAVNGCFVVGADGETEASLVRLRAFLHNAPFAEIQLTLATPFPGTALRARLEKEGRLLSNRGWSHHTLFDLTYRPDRMSVEALESAFQELIVDLFSGSAEGRRREIRHRIERTNRRAGGWAS